MKKLLFAAVLAALQFCAGGSQADVVGTVSLFEAGTYMPVTAIDFGSVPVGQTATFAFDLTWDFGYPWGVSDGSFSIVTDPAPPFKNDYSIYTCSYNINVPFHCNAVSASFTPAALGKIDGTLTIAFDAFLSTCLGDQSPDVEGGPIICAETGEVVFEDIGTAYLQIPITGVGVTAVPLPAALPLLASSIGVLGVFGWCRRKVSIGS